MYLDNLDGKQYYDLFLYMDFINFDGKQHHNLLLYIDILSFAV